MHILAQEISSPTISSTSFKWKEWRVAYAKAGKNGISIPLGSGHKQDAYYEYVAFFRNI